MARLRVSLTIPGAVSLGAYEGGALAALIVALKALGEETIVVDSIAAASAGSITGLLTARALLRGVDPVTLLSDAWVRNVSFHAMRTHSTASPLSSTALTAMAEQVLGPGGVPDGHPGTWQGTPVHLSMALTSLAGLEYQLAGLGSARIDSSTFLDFYTVTLTEAATSADYLVHAQAAIASGSNAIGFPAKKLQRSASQFEVGGPPAAGAPADGPFWYTDGGTVDNEPLGRTIDLAQRIDGGGDKRLYLLIHPDPAVRAPSPVWGGDAPQPPWLRTGTHALSIGRAQSIYQDLVRLEEVNARLRAIESAVEEPRRAEVRRAAGLEDKDLVAVEVISPLVDPTVTTAPAEQLAGAFFFHFGGFFDIRYRMSDFALGYRNMAYWLVERLGPFLPGTELDQANAEVQRRYDELGWDRYRFGGATLASLSFGKKLSLLRLGLHVARVVVHDLFHGAP